jgi:hypothetical protein
VRRSVNWTPDLDDRLRTLRRARNTWDQIASAMGLGRNTVLERGRKIGAKRAAPPPPDIEEAKDRPARCAGHPDTWGLINMGTVLAGSPYPYPVYL